ncbi:glutathione S-transferase [Alteromonas lipotrueae]|uniref:glutathione S-transferase n=1 Tax=Alteromonas lipotrueae TaxID=2803814 RepID=UPI001C44B88A|nr:glutathione S-transferase [Alteromonas lipotrueae]
MPPSKPHAKPQQEQKSAPAITPKYEPQRGQCPILYSLRNCPYAMRGRIGLFKAAQDVEVREVVLSNKPDAMIKASAKGTVPTLVLPNQDGTNTVIDESLDVMLWALHQNDPEDLLHQQDPNALPAMLALIKTFDDEFKTQLNAYKAAKRYHENNITECRQACEVYLQDLEARLGADSTRGGMEDEQADRFIFGTKESLADIALLPFIRQFSKVERKWYRESPYPNLKQWLNGYIQSVMFNKVMTQYELWKPT